MSNSCSIPNVLSLTNNYCKFLTVTDDIRRYGWTFSGCCHSTDIIWLCLLMEIIMFKCQFWGLYLNMRKYWDPSGMGQQGRACRREKNKQRACFYVLYSTESGGKNYFAYLWIFNHGINAVAVALMLRYVFSLICISCDDFQKTQTK